MNYGEMLKGAAAVATLAFAALVALWHKVLGWATSTLFPWIEKNLPSLIETAREAFSQFDKYVANPIRRGIKIAWHKLRQQLLKMATHLEKISSSKWVSRTTSWVIKTLESKQVVKIEKEVEVGWDDLPSDVKEAYIKNNKNSAEFNVTEIRDKEIEDSMSLEMTN